MKTNTVLLSLEAYDELKRIEKEYEMFCETDLVLIKGGWLRPDAILTTDSVIRDLSERLKEKDKLINELAWDKYKYDKIPKWIKTIF